MGNRRQRIADVSPTSALHSRNIIIPKTTNATNTNISNPSRLIWFDGIAQSDSEGVPFIMVNGMCARNRLQLHLALTKCEERRMNWVQNQCCALPLLKYLKPAMKMELKTEEEEAHKEIKEFQEDLKQLCIADFTLEEIRKWEGTITPIKHFESDGDLVSKQCRLEEMRSRLEVFRRQQTEPALSTRPNLDLSLSSRIKRPEFQRQSAFEAHKISCPGRDVRNPPCNAKTDQSHPSSIDQSRSSRIRRPQFTRQGTFDVPQDYQLAKNSTSGCVRSLMFNSSSFSRNKSSADNPKTTRPVPRGAIISQSRNNCSRSTLCNMSLMRYGPMEASSTDNLDSDVESSRLILSTSADVSIYQNGRK